MQYPRPRKSKYNLQVQRSQAGLGLFTNSEIKRRRFVVEYFGPILNEKQADNKGGKYLFEINKDNTIDGAVRKNIARYINHSCRPNCDAEIYGKMVYIYSRRNIKPGEELSYDYGKEYFDEYIGPYGCKCIRCKGKKYKKKKV